MPATRRRRIVRRAVMALSVVVLLVGGWLATREAPEIQRSRAVKLGMTRSEVDAIMGTTGCVNYSTTASENVLYGAAKKLRLDLLFQFRSWFGVDLIEANEDWPVRIRLSQKWGEWIERVDRIERGDEVEE